LQPGLILSQPVTGFQVDSVHSIDDCAISVAILVFPKDVLNDLACDGFLTGEEEVVHDSASGVPHRDRLGNVLESGRAPEPFSKRLGYLLVSDFFFSPVAEEIKVR
jgi:hypothetical protein